MKKILLLSLFACLLSCNSNMTSNANKSSNSMPSNGDGASIGSNVTSNNNTSNNNNASSMVSTSINKPIIPDINIDDEFDEFGKKVYSRNAKENLLSQRQIANVNESLTTERPQEYRRMKNSSSSSSFIDTSVGSAETGEGAVSADSAVVEGNLSGEITTHEFDPRSASKMLNEPCSKAFTMLQRLIFSGNGSYDFSNKTIDGIRVTRFAEDSSITLIRYGDYNVFVCDDEVNPYCFSVSIYDGGGFSINYHGLDGFAAYWSNGGTFFEEFDLLEYKLRTLNDYSISTLPLKLYRNILEAEGGNPDAWSKDTDLDLSNFVGANEYLNRLEDLYFSRYSRISGEDDEFIINDTTLEGVSKLVTSYYLPIPEGVTKIANLMEKTRYDEVSAVYIPSSVKEIEHEAFKTLGVDMYFIDEDKANLSEEYINALVSSSPNARIYYKDNWEKLSDIIMPKEYYYSTYENNIDGIYIKDKIAQLNKLLQFGSVISANEYNALLDEYNELVNNLVQDSTFIENINDAIYIFFDKVLSKVDYSKNCYFYKLVDGKEVIVENPTGEQFIYENLLMAFEEELKIIEHITIRFNTTEWPTVQLAEYFGENVIPDYNKEGVVFSSKLEDNSVVIDLEVSYFEEFQALLLDNGFQISDYKYWKRVDDSIVTIIFSYNGTIFISTDKENVTYPTTNVTIEHKEVRMKDWPSEEIIKTKAPFYIENMPRFYSENDPLFQVMFTLRTIQCSATYSVELEQQFMNILEEDGFTPIYGYYDSLDGTGPELVINYYEKEYENCILTIYLQNNNGHLNVIYLLK